MDALKKMEQGKECRVWKMADDVDQVSVFWSASSAAAYLFPRLVVPGFAYQVCFFQSHGKVASYAASFWVFAALICQFG